MPLLQPRVACRYQRLALAVLFALLLPLLLGWGVSFATTYWSLQARMQQAADASQNEVARIMRNAQQAARSVVSLAGAPCSDDVLYQLRQQASTVLYVRTVNLVRAEQLYCSSLFGPVENPAPLTDYAAGHARLMAGNILTPREAVFIWREAGAKKDTSVLAAISGGHLHAALRPAGMVGTIALQLGPNWMDSEGRVHQGETPRHLLLEARRSAAHFPFTVVASVSISRLLDEAWADYEPMLILLLLLGPFAVWVVYQWLSQAPPSAHRLRRALATGQFVPFLQPLVDARSGRWAGAEVLLRWQHPCDGLLPPAAFIQALERDGLMGVATRQMMQHVTRALSAHADRLPPGFHLSFNLTAEQSGDPRLLDDCRDVMAAFAPGKLKLTLELIERDAFDGRAHGDFFASLDNAGVRLAIDDFGTGQSSLSYLHELHADTLKIDRSFVDAIERDSLGKVVLDAIIELGQRLKLELIAEGVETPAQRDYLIAAGVELLQGYLFARPMPLTEFIRQLPPAAALPGT